MRNRRPERRKALERVGIVVFWSVVGLLFMGSWSLMEWIGRALTAIGVI